MLKALSLYQPYAGAVALLDKTEETRSWGTRHRGPLLIASTLPTALINLPQAKKLEGYVSGIHDMCIEEGSNEFLLFGDSAAICLVDLTDCFHITASETRDFYRNKPNGFLGDFSIGRYVWKLENVRSLAKPVPQWKGRQGLYNCTDAQIQSILELNPGLSL